MAEKIRDAPRPESAGRRLLGRGLNLTSLAALGLEGTGAPPPPVLEGYAIETLLGKGGLGNVWKAVRLADHSTVALKIPHQADPAFAARLQAEAESLRALNHPHVLRCLSHGSLPDGLPWLALEYVHGAPLSVLIPAAGFSWSEALGHFRQIAAAVIHAHSMGVLHRDLKPSNVLIGHDGSLKVADFGLARSVSERVVTFSLTLSGHIAGTAEYLAPECYARDYHPAEAADIYALGVILYELLAGHPPRGAWSPVSQQKQVDVRVDDALRQALEPDPQQRFPTAQAMLDAIEVIARTPPRYAGTPRLTHAVRFMDFLWTCTGLFLFLGALGLVARIGKFDIGLPVDLVGTETIRIGTYQGVLILLTVALPFGLWQLHRLWRFRKVPLREALPSPFGLKLGSTRTAALVILLAQLFFVVAPCALGAFAWREKCTFWLQEGHGPWVQGLVITDGYRGKVAHDPWAWPKEGADYYLRERSGWISDLRSQDKDHTSYWPGLTPRLIVGLTLFAGTVVALTVLSAFARWWRFRKWGRATALLALLVLTHQTMQAEQRSRHAARDRERADFAPGERVFDLGSSCSLAHDVTLAILKQNHIGITFSVDDHLPRIADTFRCGDLAPASGEDRRTALAHYAGLFRTPYRQFTGVDHAEIGMPAGHRFAALRILEDCTDAPGAPATGSLTNQVAYGTIVPPDGIAIDRIDHRTALVWTAEPRPLSAEAATAWATGMLNALQAPPPGNPKPTSPGSDLLTPETTTPLESYFHGWIFGQGFQSNWDPDPTILPATRTLLIASLRTAFENGARPTLARPPSPAKDEPGGRRRILLEIDDRGQPATWTVDLIFTDGRWQCVGLVF